MKFRFIVFLFILIPGCSFYSFKGSIPAHIKSVYISPIKNNTLESLSDFILRIPTTHKHVFPITCSIILQLLAYKLAVLRDCEIDQPRNLAKSVTVE